MDCFGSKKMAKKTHIWQEDSFETNGHIVAGVTVENWEGEKIKLWYQVDSRHKNNITKTCDPFVLGTIFYAMRDWTDLIVHGDISPTLLKNLEEFQAAWSCWRPEIYNKIDITADREIEQKKNDENDKSIMTFSGGVDSCFTAWRHTNGSGRGKRNLSAGIIVHGFDIPLEEKEVFDVVIKKSQDILDSIGIELIPVATNLRQLGDDWEDSHGAGLASCLTLLSAGYSSGLIGSSDPYQRLNLPWGSNPVTDWMMSSNSFSIITDGAAFNRNEKVREIAKWPQARQNLRVCWEGEHKDRNCGKCEKCIRTILNFRVAGMGKPECFEQDVTDEQILAMKGLHLSELIEYEPILAQAKALGIKDSWVWALEKCISQNIRSSQHQNGFSMRVGKVIGFRRHLQKLGLMKAGADI
jgi:hypothetical protein